MAAEADGEGEEAGAVEPGGAGKQQRPAIPAGAEEIALFAMRDVDKQTREEGTVDGAVAFATEAQVGRGVTRRRGVGRGGRRARRLYRVVSLAEGFLQLRVDIAPLAHPGEVEKMLPAKLSQPPLREAFHVVVKCVPDREQREEVGVWMNETFVSRVGCGFRLGWAFARIYTAKDEDGNDLVCGLASREEFVERYEKASGLPVDRERAHERLERRHTQTFQLCPLSRELGAREVDRLTEAGTAERLARLHGDDVRSVNELSIQASGMI